MFERGAWLVLGALYSNDRRGFVRGEERKEERVLLGFNALNDSSFTCHLACSLITLIHFYFSLIHLHPRLLLSYNIYLCIGSMVLGL